MEQFASVALFASLAVVALALGLMARRYSMGVLAVGLAGIAVLTGSSIRMQQENVRLVADAAKTVPQREPSEGKKPGGEPCPVVAQPQICPGIERIAALEGELSSARERANQVAAQREAIAAKFSEAEKDLKAATGEIERLEKQLAISAAVGQRALRDRLASRQDTTSYVIEPMAASELVAGLKGAWYVVRLKGANGRPLAFDDRQFSSPTQLPALIANAGRLDADVLAPLAKDAKQLRLFLRGSADRRPIAKPTAAPAFAIAYLKQHADGRYAIGDEAVQAAVMPLRNEHLPNLRADWLRREIGPALPSVKPAQVAILENPPINDTERGVELLLHVEW